MKESHALVIGATGATGRELVKYLLHNPLISKVSIFVRRDLDLKHQKLTVHKIDFNKLNEYENLINGDVLFSVLGTTLKEAGDKKKQFLVDYIYQYNFALIASKNGINHYSLVSTIGANNKSFLFYPRMKGQLEEAVKKLSFNSIHIFQPPSLIRQSDLIRNGEKIIISIISIFNKFGILISLKPVLVKDLAKKIIYEFQQENIKKLIIFKPEDIQ
ncbi:MAG: semialdehyde dehydrogenase [Flavobacteriales bacterium]|nr:semialdehyde dehydrogenase [Flavobacteriales bacterium]|tara:strand:+ start:20840 stop:21487 length:648 start_codon:yes stop_codon:yes gene_type:complete